jgi:hypothetical protein
MGCLGMEMESYPQRKEIRSFRMNACFSINRIFEKYGLALLNTSSSTVVNLLDYNTMKIVYSKTFEDYFTMNSHYPNSFKITMKRGKLVREVFCKIQSKDKITETDNILTTEEANKGDPIEYFDNGTVLLVKGKAYGMDKTFQLVKENNLDSPLKEAKVPYNTYASVCKNDKYVVIVNYKYYEASREIDTLSGFYFELWDFKELKKIKEFKNNKPGEYPFTKGKFIDDKTCIISISERILIVDVDSFSIKNEFSLSNGRQSYRTCLFHILDHDTFLVLSKQLLYKMKTDGTILEQSESKGGYESESFSEGFFINNGKEILHSGGPINRAVVFSTELPKETKETKK